MRLASPQLTSAESVASEETNQHWYRAKIASLLASKKKPIISMRPDELEVWPTNQTEPVPSMQSSDLEAPLLVTLSPEELTRRMDVMQERQEKQAQIQHLVKSKDPILRQACSGSAQRALDFCIQEKVSQQWFGLWRREFYVRYVNV